jgi:hypothetical protein
MEDGIVTFMGSLALGSVIFATIIGLGKKYHDEDQKKKNDEQAD